jgi:hypothetical protein
MMIAAEYLRETGAKSRAIVLFSDMQADLPPGAKRKFSEREFDGIHVVALNVKQLAADNANPDVLRTRMASWEKEVTVAGAGGWQTFMDAAKLGPFLTEIRSPAQFPTSRRRRGSLRWLSKENTDGFDSTRGPDRRPAGDGVGGSAGRGRAAPPARAGLRHRYPPRGGRSGRTFEWNGRARADRGRRRPARRVARSGPGTA